jgi:hypothetical protein
MSLGTDEVLDGDLDIVHVDVSGTGGLATTDVDAGHVDTLGVLKRNYKEGETTGAGAASADGHGGVVGEDTVGDPLAYLATVYDNGGRGVDIPLLSTVQDVVLAVLGLLGGGLDVCDIGTCSWLRNGDTDADLALDERCDKAVAQLLVAELDDGGDTEGEANSDGSSGATSSTASELGTLDTA